MNITVSGNTFRDQRHDQVLGFSAFNETSIDVSNYASILQMDATEVSNVTIEGNNIFNFYFKARYSAMFAQYNTKGNFTFRNNRVFNVGYLASSMEKIVLPYANISSERAFDLIAGATELSGAIGVFDFEYNDYTEAN